MKTDRNNMDQQIDQVKADALEDKKYFAYIDGEIVEVDVKSDEEYACLMNCLEGYYLYGGDSEEDGEEVEYDDEDDDSIRSIRIKN